jgi:hypothetical protein
MSALTGPACLYSTVVSMSALSGLAVCKASKTCECRHTYYCAVQTAGPVSADILPTVLYQQQDL